MTFLDGRTPDSNHETRAVLNQSYFAHSSDDSGAAQYIFETPKTMSPKTRGQVHAFAGISILAYGFGDGDVPFSAPYLHNPALTRWEILEVARPGAEPLYHLKRYAVASPTATQPESLWVIDPQQGWLITHLERYGSDGRVVIEVTVKCEEVTKGVFLPVRAEQLVYGGRGTPDGGASVGLKTPDEPSIKHAITFTDIKINPELADERFTIAYLGLRNRSVVQQHQLDGSIKLMIYTDNTLRELKVK